MRGISIRNRIHKTVSYTMAALAMAFTSLALIPQDELPERHYPVNGPTYGTTCTSKGQSMYGSVCFYRPCVGDDNNLYQLITYVGGPDCNPGWFPAGALEDQPRLKK